MTTFRNRTIDRRTALRGLGAALALPWLDAMVPALPRGVAAGTRRPPAEPMRALFVFAPNGVHMDLWTPARTGRAPELPHLLEPLVPVRDRLTVFSGLTIDGGRAHGDGAGDHARASASFLTCAHPRKTGGADLRAGVSVDQVLAAELGGATRFPSLELGMERGRAAGSCDSGYACAYSNNVSWRSEAVPVAKEVDPRAVFARLFGDPDAALDAEAERERRDATASVLDAVLADARSLAGDLGPADRAKLDQYLTAVRELEQRLHKEAQLDDESPVPAGALDGLRARGGSFRDRLDGMYELLALAFATDATRVATFMLGNAGSNRSYPFLDVREGHHQLSHHGGDPQKLASIARINRFHTERFAAFLQRLREFATGDGDLLQQTLVVYGSGLGDGNRHNHHDLPVLLAGGGHGGDRHERLPKETPMANLYVAVLQAMGVERERFADSTGALAL